MDTILCYVMFLYLFKTTYSTDLKHLFGVQKRIIDDLDIYLNTEEKRLTILKRKGSYIKLSNIYKREQNKLSQDVEDYVGNPINAFTLIKRLTTDFDYIENSMEKGQEAFGFLSLVLKPEDINYPGIRELEIAAQAVSRMQVTFRNYSMDVKEMAEGKLNGTDFNTPLSISDCFELGSSLLYNYNSPYVVNAPAWLLEAFRKYHEDKLPYTERISEVDIMNHIRLAYFAVGDMSNVLHWTYKLVDIDRENAHARADIPDFLQMISLKKSRLDQKVEVEGCPECKLSDEDKAQYRAVCRGDFNLSLPVSSRLTCRYMFENDPFLKIAPIKMEIMYISPDIVLFYDVISDEEIEIVKKLATPSLEVAGVYNSRGTKVITDTRVSRTAWLEDQRSDVIARLSRRVGYITGLSMETAEDFQVANYEIGGYFEPHHDYLAFSKPKKRKELLHGNRIATFMLYLSDVAEGGATLFLKGSIILPVKGAAVFWYNLETSGSYDETTLHGGCPVLQGSKWVATKWIHESGQEFRRPCIPEHREVSNSRDVIVSVQ